jgi:hypothetical protein
MKNMKKKTEHTLQEASLEKLLKRHLGAAERIAQAGRFPLQEPVEIIVETTDWQMDRHSSKKYPGAASFILAS